MPSVAACVVELVKVPGHALGSVDAVVALVAVPIAGLVTPWPTASTASVTTPAEMRPEPLDVVGTMVTG